jgi:hypothetical protein
MKSRHQPRPSINYGRQQKGYHDACRDFHTDSKINLLSPKGCAYLNLVKVPKLNFPSLQREKSTVPRMQSTIVRHPAGAWDHGKVSNSDYLGLGTIYTLRFLDSHADSTNSYCCARPRSESANTISRSCSDPTKSNPTTVTSHNLGVRTQKVV